MMLLRLVFSFFLFLQISIFAVDFDDLKDKQGKVYGSEKDEKYIYDAFFSELESWPKNNPTHSSFHFFWIYNTTDYPKYSKSQFFPFYSFQKSKIDKREETNFLLLYNSETDEKSNDSMYFFPFYFQGKSTNKNYTYLPLFLTSFSEFNYGKSKENTKLIGPFYSNSLMDEVAGFQENTIINPFYYSNDLKSKSGNSSSWFFPIIPLVYSSEDQKSSRKNFFWFIDYTIEKDSLTRFFFIPFYFYKKENLSENKIGESSLLLPIFYKSNVKNGNFYLNLFGLFSYEQNQKSERVGTQIFPFYFYKKDEYNIIFPLKFSFGSESEKAPSGKTYGLFYYHYWDEKEEENLKFNYYTKTTKATNGVYKTLFPFYFSNNDDNEDSIQFLNFYSNKNKKTGNYFKTFFPIYNSWKTDKSDGYVVFPFYINIDYPNKTNFNLNLLGFAKNSSKGIYSPDINLDAGRKDSYTYLDTDFSWFYNILKIETRISTKLFEEIKEELNFKKNSTEEKTTKSESPKIQKKKDFTRENTLNFYGFNFLFSAFSFERGDSKRHFRLLPLTWLTWDTNSKDQLIVAPLFVYFNDEISKYIVAFPFYGNQETPEEKRSAYGLFLKIDEEYKENNHKEHSYIWPILNYYSSNSTEGSRLIPFYRYRRTWSESEENKNTISVLYYSNFYLNDSGVEKGLVVSPFWFYNLDKKNEKTDSNHFTFPFYLKTYEENKLSEFNRFFSLPFYISSKFNKETNLRESIFWTVPVLLFRNRDKDEITWNSFFINNYFDSPRKNNLFISGIYYHNLEYDKEQKFLSTRWVLPLFYYQRKLPREFETYDKLKLYLPIFFYSSAENKTSLEKRYDYLIPPLLYYRSNNPEKDYYNFAFIFSYENFKRKEESNLYLTPFFSVQLKSDLNKNYFFPIYYFKKTKQETYFANLLFSNQTEKLNFGDENTFKIPFAVPFLFYKNSIDTGEFNLNFLSLIYYRSNSVSNSFGFFPIFGKKSTDTSFMNFFAPIYYSYNDETKEYKISELVTLPFYYKNHNYSGRKYSKYQIPFFIPFLYNYENENDTIGWNLFSFIYSRNSKFYSSTGFFPIYHFSDTINDKNELVESNSYFFPYYQSKDNYNEIRNIMGILYHQNYSKIEKSNSVSILYPLIHTKSSQESFQFQNLFGLIEYNSEKDFSDFNFFWLGYKNHSDSSSLNLFPLFYSKDTKAEKTKLILPLLTYTNNSKAEEFQSTGLSILYHSKKDLVTKEEDTFWLLGILYYKIKRPAERGYEGQGSLWGVLWEYKTESETNYKKFSILKVITIFKESR